MNTDPLWTWVNERHAIYWRKAGTPAECGVRGVPLIDLNTGFYTNDPILREYSFCNVFRELDRVTVWIEENIRKPFADHPDLWLMLAIARYINWPDTLQKLITASETKELDCWPSQDFTPEFLSQAMNAIAEHGEKMYTGAYMIRAESNPKAEWYDWSKHSYIARIVIGRLWEDREMWRGMLDIAKVTGESLPIQSIWKAFQQPRYIGWGPFMAYQVCVDLRHTRYLQNAPDINTWSALGPGSRRGLNRLMGRPVNAPLSQEQGLQEMLQIYEEQDRRRAPWVPHIDLSDIQNCLCETDKYLRVKLGEGRPRSKYIPGRNS